MSDASTCSGFASLHTWECQAPAGLQVSHALHPFPPTKIHSEPHDPRSAALDDRPLAPGSAAQDNLNATK